MSALTTDISRTCYGSNTPSMTIPVKTGEVFKKGSIVTVKAGLAYNGTNSDDTHVAVGIAYQSISAAQSAGGDGAANGGADVIVEPGTFGDFDSDTAGGALTFLDRLTTVYVKDDNTLSKTSTSRCSVQLYDVADDDTTLVAQFKTVDP